MPIQWEVLFCDECFCAFDVPKRPPGRRGRTRSVCDECKAKSQREYVRRSARRKKTHVAA